MCGNFPNIKVVEGNAFSLVLPLKRRTFESCQPIDEDIDATQLTDVVVKFGGVEYTPSLGVDGVTIILPATLARGTYDIVLTAKYQGTDIRAAYESAISIVPWNSQSDAQQFVPGSPIVCDAAYVIGGALTDAELEQLKEEYREKNAQLDQAIADAEAAKEHYDQLAEQLTGVAQEQTLTDGVTAIRDDISHIDIDTSDLAKQGTNPNATLTDTQAAAQNAETAAGQAKQAADDAKAAALALPNAQEITDAVLARINVGLSTAGLTFSSGVTINNGLELLAATNNITEINVTDPIEVDEIFGNYPNIQGFSAILFPWSLFRGLKKLVVPFLYYNVGQNNIGLCDSLVNLEYVDIRNATIRNNRMFYGCTNLKYINILNIIRITPDNYLACANCPNLIDIVCGAGLTANYNLLGYWSPTNALRNDISTLVDEGETFANNLEKLLYNIREHIAANLPDRTGLSSLTITFQAYVKAAIQADTATSNAFANKNWTIA